MKNYCKKKTLTAPDFYTDMAVERRRADLGCAGIEYKRETSPVGVWERVRVYSEEGARSIGRPKGRYDTLTTECLELFEEDDCYDVQEEIARELCRLCDDISVMPARILVVGLGNRRLTADSIGPRTAELVKPTLHIREINRSYFDELECSEIAVFAPGVASESGMPSIDCVRGITERVMPDLIIAVDSVRTSSEERLGRSFQLSDTGLFPGGMGALSSALTRGSIGVPVIGIGVPTVMDARCLSGNFEGARGELYISPKDIDEVVGVGARIIAGGINQAFGLDY